MQLSQGAKQLIPPLVRALTTSNAAAAGSSVAVATKPSSSGGLISMFGFGSSRVSTPMSEPLSGVQQPLRGSLPSNPGKLESSVIADGVKVASITSASPVATIALVVSGGSSAETSATAGASKVLEAMAFKATRNRTTFRITRELEKLGAVAYAQAGRDTVSFAIDTVKLHVPEATEILLDAVLNARLQYHEVRENLDVVKEVMASCLANPAYVLEEVLHRVAYDGPLGQPLLVDPKALGGFSHETLQEYYDAMLQPSNLLLASIGADHAELKNVASPLFSAAHLGKGAPAPAASPYVGGTSNVIAADSPLTHVALAFEAKGGLSDAKGSALAAVAKALLDESRSTLPWSSRDDGVAHSMSSFAHMYKGTGLVGIMASSLPHQSSQLIDAIYKKVGVVTSGVSDAQLQQAKHVAVAAQKSSLASASTGLPVIASQLLASGSFDAASFAKAVDAITPASIASYVKDMVKASPTMVTYGGLSHMPRYESITKRLA